MHLRASAQASALEKLCRAVVTVRHRLQRSLPYRTKHGCWPVPRLRPIGLLLFNLFAFVAADPIPDLDRLLLRLDKGLCSSVVPQRDKGPESSEDAVQGFSSSCIAAVMFLHGSGPPLCSTEEHLELWFGSALGNCPAKSQSFPRFELDR